MEQTLKTRNTTKLRKLKLSLKYRPDIYKLILKLRQAIRNKTKTVIKLKLELKKTKLDPVKYKDSSCQTEPALLKENQPELTTAWSSTSDSEQNKKSITDQVAEVAQSALSQSGMVYVESAKMYYDYKTGYYYNSDLGLYYHTDTNCYYTYSNETQQFQFHSYPDMSKMPREYLMHEKKKAKKHKQVGIMVDEVESLTNSLSMVSITYNPLEFVAKHHPPCMRVIVKETKLPKLKVGTLFLITKDGGTIGREGENHTILLKEQNVSRNHLDVRYDALKKAYVATDVGSKNGTILNGHRMSESQITSEEMAIPHGSILQLGVTKLLCHIHAGNDTCGHCEPGLIMQAEETEKPAYTRTCSVQVQHQLELARLKNKYGPQAPLAIEDGSYNDRAKVRRETVGSSHNSEKTQQADLSTSIEPNNKGFQLLKKMGWSKGEGLGKDNQGDTEPVPLVSNENKSGLGAAGSAETVKTAPAGPVRFAPRARTLRPVARAFRESLEDD